MSGKSMDQCFPFIPEDHAFLLIGDFILTLGISSFVFSFASRKIDKIIFLKGNNHSAPFPAGDMTTILTALSIVFIVIGLGYILYIMNMPVVVKLLSKGKELKPLFSHHFKTIEFSKLLVAQIYTIGALLFFSKASQLSLLNNNGPSGGSNRLGRVYSDLSEKEKEKVKEDTEVKKI